MALAESGIQEAPTHSSLFGLTAQTTLAKLGHPGQHVLGDLNE